MSAGRYAHIGGPKNASTSIQTHLLAVHPELYHLGLGVGGRGHRSRTGDVTAVIESDLRYKREFAFDLDRARNALAPHLEYADGDPAIRAAGLSSEFLSFTLHNEIDAVAKATRLRDLLGPDARIVFVFREQFAMLQSVYLELIRGGYGATYDQFLEYTFRFQDRNWCLDLCFDRVIELYASLFGPGRVCALAFESLKTDPLGFSNAVCDGLGISRLDAPLPNTNRRLESLGVYEHIRRLNARFPHGLDGKLFEPPQCGRLASYFVGQLGLDLPADRLADEIVRIPIREIATRLQNSCPAPDIDLTCHEVWRERLAGIFGPSNRRLASLAAVPRVAGYVGL